MSDKQKSLVRFRANRPVTSRGNSELMVARMIELLEITLHNISIDYITGPWSKTAVDDLTEVITLVTRYNRFYGEPEPVAETITRTVSETVTRKAPPPLENYMDEIFKAEPAE